MSDDPKDPEARAEAGKEKRRPTLKLGGAVPVDPSARGKDSTDAARELSRVLNEEVSRIKALEPGLSQVMHGISRASIAAHQNTDWVLAEPRRAVELQRASLATAEHLATLLEVTLMAAEEEKARREEEREQWRLAEKRWQAEKRLLFAATTFAALSAAVGAWLAFAP